MNSTITEHPTSQPIEGSGDFKARELCLALMRAHSEDEVIDLLESAGYWQDQPVWRYYGDYENNYNSIGNQQSRPDAALVEKLVNAIDARLMNECLVRGIDPEGGSAPPTIEAAVAQFFDENKDAVTSNAGRIKDWPDARRSAIARGITLAATGPQGREGSPSFTISDCGEGQTPEMMPRTLLSLKESNKLRIPFVQGKFNMGGSGVLEFCGRHNLQLVVSRRNPAILCDQFGQFRHPSDNLWGFTIVRREDPIGGRRSSVFTYLAPVGAQLNPGNGGVLRFAAGTMPIFPQGREPYAREAEWGTLVKLYEYSTVGFSKTHILRKDGLLSRIDLLLPDVALPIRLHECRPGYQGHEGSFDTTLTGLGVRLDDDKADNLEPGFPSSCQMNSAGEQMTATIYAFKAGKADTYRRNEGIIFTLNGQTHGYLTVDFFRRNKVGLSYLSDSILVMVDCSSFSGRARENLFMNSRDRLRSGALRSQVERDLEDLLKNHDGLRSLKERRQRELIESKLSDARPLENVLETLLKRSPTLSAIFLEGTRVSTPFKTKAAQAADQPFTGKRYPTYFRFKGRDHGTELQRDCHINMRCRILFETDAANDYFRRDVDQGEFSLYRVTGATDVPIGNYIINLHNGVATLSLQLPSNCAEGDLLQFVSTVSDRTRFQPFRNPFTIRVKGPADISGGSGVRRRPPVDKPGGDYQIPSGISLPRVIEIREEQWQRDGRPFPFDERTALRIVNVGPAGESRNGGGPDTYDFYVNMDNVWLKNELKLSKADPRLASAQFKFGLVLLGLALLHRDEEQRSRTGPDKNGESEEEAHDKPNVEDTVSRLADAVAPFLVPMIASLGSMTEEEIVTLDASGEAT